MRRLKIIAFAFLAAFLLATLLLRFFVSVDTLKGPLLTRLEAATGRKVTAGALHLSVFPDIALAAEDVTIGNPSWAEGDFARIKQLRLGVALMPLLHHDLRLTEVTLKQPVITLIEQGGKVNWQWNAKPETTPQAASVAAAQSSGSQWDITRLSVGKVSIDGGSVTLKSSGSGTKSVTDVDLKLSAGTLNDRATLEATATYNVMRASLSAGIASPAAALQGTPTEASMKASWGNLGATWKGKFSLKNGVPFLTGSLTIPELDTTAWPQDSAPAAAAPRATAVAVAPESSHWSDAPLTIRSDYGVNANLAVTIGSLILPKTTLKDISATLRAENSTLTVATEEVRAYDGTLRLSLRASPGNALSLSVLASGVRVGPLLHDFADSDALAGTLSGNTDVTARGASERALVESLAGKGDFILKDGSVKGVDFEALMHNILAKGGEQRTAFSQASGSFAIAGGVVSNHDLNFTAQTLRATGSGTVDLPRWQVHYLLRPVMLAGAKDAKGITVPLHIDGSLDHPSYRPDVGAVVQETLKDPKAMKENLRELKKQLITPDALHNILR